MGYNCVLWQVSGLKQLYSSRSNKSKPSWLIYYHTGVFTFTQRSYPAPHSSHQASWLLTVRFTGKKVVAVELWVWLPGVCLSPRLIVTDQIKTVARLNHFHIWLCHCDTVTLRVKHLVQSLFCFHHWDWMFSLVCKYDCRVFIQLISKITVIHDRYGTVRLPP